ncbi:MAG: YbjQ family protein [bacterium]|nr:YbjQ family protein [bacterium]
MQETGAGRFEFARRFSGVLARALPGGSCDGANRRFRILGPQGGQPCASLQTIFGGNITLFTQLCERTPNEAFDMMVLHAEQLGANAMIGVRYDATEVMSGVSEVLCYGTAVTVEPDPA